MLKVNSNKKLKRQLIDKEIFLYFAQFPKTQEKTRVWF
jgi:hypothetical protein